MQIKFLDNLDSFLTKELKDNWNYTYEATEDSLQITMNVWLDKKVALSKPVEKLTNKELKDG
jgi:hypothetical protein